MKRSRPFHFVATLIALFSILFMQFAVAAYACPTLKAGQGEDVVMASAMDIQGMSGCEGVDIEKPNLCKADSQKTSQSLDKAELRQVQSFAPAQLVATVIPVNRITPVDPSRTTPAILVRTTAPPLSIRNCCFRI